MKEVQSAKYYRLPSSPPPSSHTHAEAHTQVHTFTHIVLGTQPVWMLRQGDLGKGALTVRHTKLQTVLLSVSGTFQVLEMSPFGATFCPPVCAFQHLVADRQFSSSKLIWSNQVN